MIKMVIYMPPPFPIATDSFLGRTDGKALVKLVPPSLLRAAREEKAQALAEKEKKKQAAAAAAEAKRIDRLEKGRTKPEDMFRSRTEEYGSFDSEGVPVTDAKGVEISKKGKKNLMQLRKKQGELHEEFLEWERTERGGNSF